MHILLLESCINYTSITLDQLKLFNSYWWGWSLQMDTLFCSFVSSTTHEVYIFLTVFPSYSNPRFIELPGNCVFYTNSDFSSSFFLHALLGISSWLQLWWHTVHNYYAFRSSVGQQWVFSYLIMSILSRWSAEFFVCEEYDFAPSINSTFHLYE